jgi:hypothetical protein
MDTRGAVLFPGGDSVDSRQAVSPLVPPRECGRGLVLHVLWRGSPVRWWEAKAHSEGCPFWREAAKFDIPKLRAQGQKLKMTVQRCEFEFKLSNSL